MVFLRRGLRSISIEEAASFPGVQTPDANSVPYNVCMR